MRVTFLEPYSFLDMVLHSSYTFFTFNFCSSPMRQIKLLPFCSWRNLSLKMWVNLSTVHSLCMAEMGFKYRAVSLQSLWCFAHYNISEVGTAMIKYRGKGDCLCEREKEKKSVGTYRTLDISPSSIADFRSFLGLILRLYGIISITLSPLTQSTALLCLQLLMLSLRCFIYSPLY